MITVIAALKKILIQAALMFTNFITKIGNIIIDIFEYFVKLILRIPIFIGNLFIRGIGKLRLQDFYSRLRCFYLKTSSVKKEKKNAVPKRKEKIILYIPRFSLLPFAKKIFKSIIKVIVMVGQKMKREQKFIIGSLFGTFVGGLIILFTVTLYNWYYELPRPELLAEQSQRRSTKILDRKGRLLYEIYEDRKYDPVDLDKIPAHVLNSTLAIEDDQFYEHKGIRALSIIRAAKANILEDDFQGGSTITQQLVKNVLLTPERTWERKLKEAALALMVEKKYSKNEILGMYMNNIPYGGTAWGVQSAAQKYFGKNVWELSLGEAALLAGLPSAPTSYSPVTGGYDKSKERQKIVLDRMVQLSYITQEEADKAYEEELSFAPQVEYIKAPHFVWYVRSLLETIYGSRSVNRDGLIVTTTLDLDLQEKVQEIVKDQVEKSRHLNISNGAALVLNPKNGEIVAYVGSKDYFAESYGAFDVLTSHRQPGSSIKPVTYALAFTKGMTPNSKIEDAPVTFKNAWETYKPVNYDGAYHGTVTLRQALANSYNIPAVKLLNRLGPDNMVDLGRNMGLKDWETDGSYGISVTLGGKEVRPIDLANVYATLARGGIYKETTPFISIKDINGNELYKPDTKEERVLSPETSYIVTSILSDYYARLPAFGTNNYLSVRGHDIAVKTGTTDLKRDNWTIGYTPSYVTAVWVGNNDNTPMNRFLASGLSGAAPMWNRIMTLLLNDKSNERFPIPDKVRVVYDEKCKATEVFVRGTDIPDTLCEDDNKDKDKDKDDDD